MEDKDFKTGTVMDTVSTTDDTNKALDALTDASIATKMPLRRTRTIIRVNEKIGRNEPCPCGSGKKYKKCCLDSGEYEHCRELDLGEMTDVRLHKKNLSSFKKTV